MLTPIVTEVPRAFEPVVLDSFISRDFAGRAPRQQSLPANVVAISAHRSRREQADVVPARVA